MIKVKLLLGLAALATTFIVLAAPAMAEFESTGTGSQGKVITFPEKTIFKSAPGGPAIECKNAGGEPWAEWVIQVKTFSGEQQAAAHKGPHELLQIKKWGTCTGPTGIAAKVSCYLQVEQAGPNGNTGSVYPPGCKVFLGGENFCEVNVAFAGNKELSEVKLANNKNSQGGSLIEIVSNVSGITSTLNEKGEECKKPLGLTAGKEGSFKTEGKPLITEGQKLV